MPTIEIISPEAVNLELRQHDFDVAIIEQHEVVSHRGLFSDFLRGLRGVIVHLGNPDFRGEEGGFFFAGALVDCFVEPVRIELPQVDVNDPDDPWGAGQVSRFRFWSQYRRDVYALVRKALDASPIHRAYLLTDYQFGPETGAFASAMPVKGLWAEHDTKGLTFNTLYTLVPENA